jgi:cobalt-zinc-cadmium efflux system membrane fusion protein
MIRIWILLVGIACGALLTSFAPGLIQGVRTYAASIPGMAWLLAEQAEANTEPHAEGHEQHDKEGMLDLSDQQIAEAGIEVAPAKAGAVSRRRFVPGTIVPAADHIARVAVRLLGTVAELRKRLGDPVSRTRSWP